MDIARPIYIHHIYFFQRHILDIEMFEHFVLFIFNDLLNFLAQPAHTKPFTLVVYKQNTQFFLFRLSTSGAKK